MRVYTVNQVVGGWGYVRMSDLVYKRLAKDQLPVQIPEIGMAL